MRTQLIFQNSPWLVLICLAVGVAFAWLLYQPNAPWSKNLNRILAVLRGALVALICFLLMAPLLRNNQNTIEKPKVLFAIDNSASVGKSGTSLLAELKKAEAQLANDGYEVGSVSLTGESNTDSLSFTAKQTNLAGLLGNVRTRFEGQNLTDVILLSDGIVNQGSSPAFSDYPFKIHTIGVGDTIPKLDIRIRNIIANRVAYLGNNFPIQVDVQARDMKGRSTSVSLKHNGKVIATQPVNIDRNDFFGSYTFNASSQQKGLQHFTVETAALSNEQNIKNNRREVYVDIIDGREKILILALAPHPDIKAIRAVIESNDNFETDVRILSLNPPVDYQTKPYDLVILHQLPDLSGQAGQFLKTLREKAIPTLWVLGPQSNINSFNTENGVLRIAAQQGQTDKVSAQYNSGFQLFNFLPEQTSIFEKLPPVNAPFGTYQNLAGTEVILYQKLGNLATSRPLLAINTTSGRKSAVLTGDGIWRWRLEEYASTEDHSGVDIVVNKVVQLLSLKEDKRKFRVFPVKPEFDSSEPAELQTEVYNDLYERIYGQEVTLQLTRENEAAKNYTYSNTADAGRFQLSGLAEGVYRFKASTTLNGKEEQVSGEFIVKDEDLELANTTADFGLLRETARKSGGEFIKADQLADLVKKIGSSKPADRLNNTEELAELIQLKWLFLLLLFLAALEWGLRKYHGSY